MMVPTAYAYRYAVNIALGAIVVSAISAVLGCALADHIVAKHTPATPVASCPVLAPSPSRPELADPLP